MQRYIVSGDTLKSHTGLSLADRCKQINDRYEFPRMNVTLLRSIYRKYGVKKKAYKYLKVITPDL